MENYFVVDLNFLTKKLGGTKILVYISVIEIIFSHYECISFSSHPVSTPVFTGV